MSSLQVLLLSKVVLVGFLFVLDYVSGHPQCLDYKAPFKAKTSLQFCSQYSSFGCCTAENDTEIAQSFNQLKAKFSLQSRPSCEQMLKEIVCLRCDPYAAHIFEAEGNRKFDASKATPGLCPNFCSKFHTDCSDIVNYHLKKSLWNFRELPTTPPSTPTPTNQSSSRKRNAVDDFCNKIRLSDMDYCYPDVKNLESNVLARKYNKGKNDGCLCVEKVVDGVRNPVVAVHSGDGTHRLFIGEQVGVVYILMPNTKRLLNIPFLDIKYKVLTSNSLGDERGFLSLAFHPKYKENGRFFVYYSTRLNKSADDTSNDHKTVLSEFLVSDRNPNRADHGSEKVILEFPQPEENHNGGQILFGNDGMLYLTVGDGGAAGDPFGKIGNGLNLQTLLGSIIRIDIDTKGKKLYKIPPDNPFLYHFDTKTRPEIYAYGVRNMWRCSIDRGDKNGRDKGRFFCGDVGQNKYEEIDLIEKGGNYGWRAYEAFECFDKDLCVSSSLNNAIFPIFAYNHTVGKSILGGYVYRGCQNPNLYGYYIFGDTWSSRFFTLIKNRTTRRWDHRELCFGDDKYCTDNLKGEFGQFVLSFGEDEAGELYLLATPNPKTLNPTGAVYRLIDPSRRGDPTKCAIKPVKPAIPVSLKRRRKTKICQDTLNDFYPTTSIMNCASFRWLGFCSLRSIGKYCMKTCDNCPSQ